ncbi:uncharacterized protein LOC117123250 [Anneissia japonica]|uniref:uncharacterized protein LOC117123250 n=1 Tax=Anneissia japonica TaxID=1529436 RepID=UPI0014254CB0|nr:uncharacterized protein LOC117123250 [Anneissia japonica]
MSTQVVEAVKQVTRPTPTMENPSWGPSPYQGRGACYNCGIPGHFSKECRSQVPGTVYRGVQVCYNCRRPGHISRECRAQGTRRPRHTTAPYNAKTYSQPIPRQPDPKRNDEPKEPTAQGNLVMHLEVGQSTDQINVDFISKTVGECFSVEVKFGDIPLTCLLDPGSQVTTIGEQFFYSFLEPFGFKLQEIPKPFSLVSASGATIPYRGCFETDVWALGKSIKSRVVLVIREQCSSLQNWRRTSVGGILGMNVPQQCWERLISTEKRQHLHKIAWPTPEPAWQKALHAVNEKMCFCKDDGKIGNAYMEKEENVVISARQAVVIEGRGRCGPGGEPFEAMPEPNKDGGVPTGVVVPPCLVKVDGGRFPVVVHNETDNEVVISSTASLGTLFHGATVHGDLEEVGLVTGPAAEVANILAVESTLPIQVDVDASLLTPKQHGQLKCLLTRYKDVFSTHDQDFGYTDTITHRIDTGTDKPIRQRHRPLPPSQYQAVRDHIRDLLEKDIVRESKSPWSSTVVVVQKKDSSIRLCVDYRRLNKITHKDSFPLPRIEESLQALDGAQYFSVLDLTSSYYQVASG